MSKGRRRAIPARRKTKDDMRAEYRKNLSNMPVSGTMDEPSEKYSNGTGFISDDQDSIEHEQLTAPKETNLKKFYQIVGAIVGICSFIGFVFWVGVNYSSINKNIEFLQKEVAEVKQNTKNELQHLNERMDNYFSAPKKSEK
jgi:hypothetical protein